VCEIFSLYYSVCADVLALRPGSGVCLSAYLNYTSKFSVHVTCGHGFVFVSFQSNNLPNCDLFVQSKSTIIIIAFFIF